MWTRRDIVKLGLLGWAFSQGLSSRALGASPRSSPRRPRYYVIVNLTGGVDSVYTTDPKLRAEVEPWVDVPYGPERIVTRGNLRLGPHLAPLKDCRRMAILNGVQLGTANHDTGLHQVVRLRTQVKARMPLILDIIGAHRDGQPLSTLTLGSAGLEFYSAGWFGLLPGQIPRGLDAAPKEDLFEEIEQSAPGDLERLAAVLRRQAGRLREGGDRERGLTASNLDQVATLLGRMPHLPPFRPEIWSEDEDAQAIAVQLQRVLWTLENDLTSGVQLAIGQQWDTHWANARIQESSSGHFMPPFARFLQELEKRRNAHGTLVDNTVVVAGSELGRLPRLNTDLGKDHLSQAPYLFFGASIDPGGARGEAFGRTSSRMEGLPISLMTGRDVAQGGHVPLLDDVGTTLLSIAGIDPAMYGYDGQLLRFLVAS